MAFLLLFEIKNEPRRSAQRSDLPLPFGQCYTTRLFTASDQSLQCKTLSQIDDIAIESIAQNRGTPVYGASHRSLLLFGIKYKNSVLKF